MARHKRKPRKYHHHPKRRLPFWKAVGRFGFWNALKYEIRNPRKYPKYPIWFIPMIISMIIIAMILMFYPIDYLPIVFYLLEIIAVSYLVFRLLKRLNRIKIRGSDLRLYGLKLLSGLVSAFGIFLLFFTWISFPFALFESVFNQQSVFTQIVSFGSKWHTPYVIPLFLEVLGLGLCLIGGYLLFKFKRGAGGIIWVGRI